MAFFLALRSFSAFLKHLCSYSIFSLIGSKVYLELVNDEGIAKTANSMSYPMTSSWDLADEGPWKILGSPPGD